MAPSMSPELEATDPRPTKASADSGASSAARMVRRPGSCRVLRDAPQDRPAPGRRVGMDLGAGRDPWRAEPGAWPAHTAGRGHAHRQPAYGYHHRGLEERLPERRPWIQDPLTLVGGFVAIGLVGPGVYAIGLNTFAGLRPLVLFVVALGPGLIGVLRASYTGLKHPERRMVG